MSSSAKEIIFDEEARQKLSKGIKHLTDVVRFTLGPKGRNVGLEKSWGAPSITNDGNSIIKEIELADTFENIGVSMAKEVAEKIQERCGDGTTTGTILLNALVDSGMRLIASGANPISIKRGIDKATAALLSELESMAHTITTEEETRSIATVSASSDEFIGNLISEAVEKVGRSGVITIEEGKTTDTALELVEGLQFDRGYISAYFCSNAEKMITEMANPKVLIVDKKISNIHEILPLLQSSMSSGSELLIIAEDVEGDALSTLVVNRLRGTLRAAAVKAPGFGDRRKAMLQDIATLTGATVISDDTGISLKEVGTEVLGAAEKITLTKENTTIIGGAGTTDAIAARIKEIDAETAAASSSYDKEKLQERKAKLSGGVAVIRVGAATEPEVKQLKQVFEDSLSSTQAALAEGVVTGGGVALLRASQALKKLSLEGDEAIGLQIVQEACQAPLRQIVTNTGDDASVALQEVLASTDLHTGFNALTGEITNLFNAGVIDAVKVIKHALSSAASVAGIVLISEAIITDAEEDEES